MRQEHDPVNRPNHYTSGKIEVIDFIEDQKLGFHLGNVVKYVARAGKKDKSKEVEDLRKARWYLDRKIEQLDGKPEPGDDVMVRARQEFEAGQQRVLDKQQAASVGSHDETNPDRPHRTVPVHDGFGARHQQLLRDTREQLGGSL